MVEQLKYRYNQWLFKKYGFDCGVSFEKIPTIYKLSPLWSPSLYIQYEGEIVRNWFLQEMKGCETKKASDFIIEELESLGYKESAAIFRNQEKYYS